MRTTLTIEDDVAIRIERIREERGGTLKAVVNEALRRGLDAMERPSEDRPRYRIEPVDLGRCKVPNLDKTSAVLAFAEGEDYR
jgi:hypothetical protein